MKKKSLVLASCVALALLLALAGSAWAAAGGAGPDTVNLTGIVTTPSSTQNGQGKNYVLDADVQPGASITLNFSVASNGAGSTSATSTNYPDTVVITPSTVLGAETVSVSGLVDAVLSTRSTSVSETAMITAPQTPGDYQVKFTADDGRTGNQGKINGDSFIINFTVVAPTSCTPTIPSLVLNTPDCVLYHATSMLLSATLKDGITPLVGKTITFYVDSNAVGTGITDSTGLANLTYNPSSLSAGDHDLSAEWETDDACNLDSTSTGGVLGVQYLFKGFQPPINADGNTVLTGKCGPVKVCVLDANGVPVPDAKAYVYFADSLPVCVGDNPENVTAGLNFDHGNQMRYSDGQYVYNWDLSTVCNGTKYIQVLLGEGSCAAAHTVCVSVGKKSK
jgi:hypothetical protein